MWRRSEGVMLAAQGTIWQAVLLVLGLSLFVAGVLLLVVKTK